MGRVLKLSDYREMLPKEEPPGFFDEEIIEFLNEAIKNAMGMMTERAAKEAIHRALRKTLDG